MNGLIIHKPKHHWIIICVVLAVTIIIAVSVWFFVQMTGDPHKSSSQPNAAIVTPKAQPAATSPEPTSKPTATFKPDFALPPIVNGMAPIITNFTTTQKVVFLGIDDGAYKDQSVVEVIKRNNIKASLFISRLFIASNPDFFKQITALGSIVENHTLDHHTRMTTEQSYEQQKAQICGMSDYDLQHYGRRPTLFRPPGGAYSDTMRKAVVDCGMKAIVTWIAKANGGSMQYQVGHSLRPGDVVLMHFRPEFEKDMQAFVEAENAAGVHTELLEDISSS